MKEIKVFPFNELSDKAKEKALHWGLQNLFFEDWYYDINDDFIQNCRSFGLTIEKIGFKINVRGSVTCKGNYVSRMVTEEEKKRNRLSVSRNCR